MDTVEIVFAHHHGNHLPGDRVAVDVETARRLVRGARARYATMAEAVAVEGADGAGLTVAAAKEAGQSSKPRRT